MPNWMPFNIDESRAHYRNGSTAKWEGRASERKERILDAIKMI